MSLTLNELSRRINGALLDDSSIAIKRIAPLDRALPGDLSFLSNTRFRAQLRRCRASAIIVDRASLPYCVGEPVIVDDLLIGCARAAFTLEHASRINDVRQRRSQDYEIVDPSADIARSVTVGRSVTIGAHSTIGPGCVIGDGVRIGSYCRLGPNISIAAAASLGNRVSIGANSALGGEPFLYVKDRQKWLKLPSFGSVEIGDDVDLGSHVVVDRGAIRDTCISSGSKLDSHVHVGHGVYIGSDTAIAARTAIAGEATIENGCIIGGAVGISEGVYVAARVRITAMSMVTKSLREPNRSYSSGWPVRYSARWWRHVSKLSSGRQATSQHCT